MKAQRSESIGISRISHRLRQGVLWGAVLCLAGLLWASVAKAQFFYEVIDLGTPGFSSATGINDAGQVVGYALTASGSSHAFLWENGTMTDLGTLGGGNFSSSAIDINNLGQAVGVSTVGPYPSYLHAFLYENGGMKDLEGAFGSNTRVTGINDFGEMVGRTSASGCSGGCSSYSFLYDKSGGIRDLGNLGVGDDYYNDVTGINNLGQVVFCSLSGLQDWDCWAGRDRGCFRCD